MTDRPPDPIPAPPRWWPHALVLAIFSLGWLLATGYGFGSQDSDNYIPMSWSALDPALFRHDDVFAWIMASSWSHHTSFFTLAMAGLGRLWGMEWGYFLVHLLSLWLLALGWWGIGAALGGPVVGYLTLLALITNRPVGGSAMWSLPHELQPRSLASALAFDALALLALGLRRRLATILACVANLCHPISALMALPVVALAPFLNAAHGRSRLRETTLTLGWLIVPYLAWHHLVGHGLAAETSIAAPMTAGWQQVLDYRFGGQAIDVSGWSALEWLQIALPLGLWLVALRRRAPAQTADRVLGAAMLASLLLAGLGAVGASALGSAFFAQLMLPRVLFATQVIGTAYGAWWLHAIWREGDWLKRAWALVALWAIALGGLPLFGLAALAIMLLERTLSDVWLIRGARLTALGWLGLLLVVAWSTHAHAHPVGVALRRLGAFEDPPILNVVLLAATSAMAIAVSRNLPRMRTALLALAVGCAPLWLVVANHRQTLPLETVRTLISGLQLPWAPGVGGPDRDLTTIAYWARSHTPEGSRFLLPPRLQGFRAMAERPIVVDWKDGGLAPFSEALADRWRARFQEVDGFENRSAGTIVALARKYACTYVVLPREHALPRTITYASGRLVVQGLDQAQAEPSPPGRH